MKNYTGEDFVPMQIPLSMFGAVCALLGGASLAAVAIAEAPKGGERASQGTEKLSDTSVTHGQASQESDGIGATATTLASPSDVDAGAPDIDAHGHPWNAELHASTKGTTKEGLWRMKVGVTRPDPLPGFPKADATGTGTTATSTETPPEPSASSTTATETAPAQAATQEEDDEFAAFRNAAAEANATADAAKASVPARKWTDADLGALCNQAAVKLGDPNPVKELIAAHVPEGEVAHSRNIPEESREAFAKAVEAKAGIEFAG